MLNQCYPVQELLDAAVEALKLLSSSSPEALKLNLAIKQFETTTCPDSWNVEDVKNIKPSLSEKTCKEVSNSFAYSYDSSNDREVLNVRCKYASNSDTEQ